MGGTYPAEAEAEAKSFNTDYTDLKKDSVVIRGICYIRVQEAEAEAEAKSFNTDYTDF